MYKSVISIQRDVNSQIKKKLKKKKMPLILCLWGKKKMQGFAYFRENFGRKCRLERRGVFYLGQLWEKHLARVTAAEGTGGAGLAAEIPRLAAQP